MNVAASSQTKAPPAARRRWVRFLLPFVSLLVAFSVIEVGMRLMGVEPQTATVLSTFFEYDEASGWRGKPGARSQFTTMNFDVFITHDANGFRSAGYEGPIEADATSKDPVAWVLGDSGTWGWGVPDDKTFVDLLNRLSDDGTRYRNLGHCGFSTVQQYLLLKRLFSEGKKPKEVVVFFCGNDLTENLDAADQSPGRAYLAVQGDSVELKNYPTQRSGWGLLVWLKNNSLAWNHAHFYLRRISLMNSERKLAINRAKAEKAAAEKDLAAGNTPSATAATPNPTPAPVGPASTLPREQIVGLRFIYREMLDLCADHDVKLRIVNDGSPIVTELCREMNIDCLSLTERWQRFHESPQAGEPVAFKSDPHYNELGHQLLGEAIHSELKRVRTAEATAARRATEPNGSVRTAPTETASGAKSTTR